MDAVYFKATRPDGTDFRTGTVNYLAALASGTTVRHPCGESGMIANRADTHLSVSVVAADCTGMAWPCRLFRVEPVGEILDNLTASPNKRACSALKVAEELPAHTALGPQGAEVAALIERCRTLAGQELARLAAARVPAWAAAWAAARAAAWATARVAAWVAARDTAWAAARDTARDTAWAAASALLMRDKITPEQFDALYFPWKSVIEQPTSP